MKITAEQKANLFYVAVEAKKKAHLLPGNTYSVGSAILTKEGKIFTGCNIENVAHTPTICAERVAIFKAISEGHRDIIAMMVVTDEGGSCCGVCRQVIVDLAPNIEIIMTAVQKNKEVVTSIDELLPLRWRNPSLIDS